LDRKIGGVKGEEELTMMPGTRTVLIDVVIKSMALR
jgi:hypothetical protein